MRRTAAAFLSLSLLAAPALAAEPPPGPVFNIMGSSTCSSWPKAAKAEAAAKAVPLNWVLGFASSEADRADARLFPLIDPDKVDAWMGDYCQAHPSDTLPTAARTLVAELKAELPPLAPPPPPEPPMFVPPIATPKPAPAKKPPARRAVARKPVAKAK
jgi:hypothetical protein